MADYSNKIYTLVKKESPLCKNWGQELNGNPPKFPFVYFEQEDNPGGNYDLEGRENSVTASIKITTYANGDGKKESARKISNEIRDTFVCHGFQCVYGPTKVDNAQDTSVCRYIARYRRKIASGDKI